MLYVVCVLMYEHLFALFNVVLCNNLTNLGKSLELNRERIYKVTGYQVTVGNTESSSHEIFLWNNFYIYFYLYFYIGPQFHDQSR